MLAIVAIVFWAVPRLWPHLEPLETGPDYRIPYRLSSDYWFFDRYCRQVSEGERILLLGDSVVWGHFVSARQTLSHYLNELSGQERFANLGVDGIHPVALEGLVRYYGRAIHNRPVLLHCNLLWISSPRRDLTSQKEFAFNHPKLVPQLTVPIPCYGESLSGRIGIVVERQVEFFRWVSHLQAVYFHDTSLASWTLQHPYSSPCAAITLQLPSPDEPPSPVPLAKPWTEKRMRPLRARWVELDRSLQWRSFRRVVALLRRRGSRLFVLVGPLNEHMLPQECREAYQVRKRQVTSWLAEHDIPCLAPDSLPSNCYADASHPLPEGYRLLAQHLVASAAFREFSGQ